MDEDERKALLHPPWAINGTEGVRYDALSDESKKVWRETRGQRTDEDAYATWVHELATAITQGRITEVDARDALRKWTQT